MNKEYIEKLNEETQSRVKRFVNRLEDELIKQNLTVPAFARKMGMTRRGVYRWILGETVMRLDSYYKVLEVLKIDDNTYIKKESNVKED
jgi:transcriptional regulator with XRE-family HTH domain